MAAGIEPTRKPGKKLGVAVIVSRSLTNIAVGVLVFISAIWLNENNVLPGFRNFGNIGALCLVLAASAALILFLHIFGYRSPVDRWLGIDYREESLFTPTYRIRRRPDPLPVAPEATESPAAASSPSR
jgi:hypothetical protein